MREAFLPFSPPAIGEDEIREVVDTLRSGWITTGPRTKRFEGDMTRYLDAPAALALSSGTAAMHLALVLENIGPGDEVITSPMTFTSTVAVIEHVGARPVLADVEPDTLCLDPAAVAAAVTERTRAIIAVHYGGHPCELDTLEDICARHDLVLIEDAAHALPARYKDRLIGSGPNPVAFSFYATKNLTTAEGGMLTGNPDLIDRGVVASLHGMDRDAWKRNDQGGSWRYDVVMPGFKYNMTDLQAALGLVQLRRLPDMHQRRTQVAAAYTAALAPLEAFDLPIERPGCQSAWHLYPLRLREGELSIDRDRFIVEMRERNIGTSVHFIPVHTFSYYRKKYGYKPEDFPVALHESERLVTIPLHPGLKDSDVDDVVAAAADIVASSRS